MKLTLDHTQRLNLHALLGAQRADVGSIRAIWALQDSIVLTADEEKAIELKRERVGEQDRVVWNPLLALPVKEFDLSVPDVARVKAVLLTWDGYAVRGDRSWLEPLLRVLLEPEVDGQAGR